MAIDLVAALRSQRGHCDPGRCISGGLDGHLCAYASDDGDIIWDVDTAQKCDTVNGVPANGGSLDGPGPVVVGGMVFVNSGYAFVGGMPGNVLLAFPSMAVSPSLHDRSAP